MKLNSKRSLIMINGWGNFNLIWDPFINSLQDQFEIKLIHLNSFCHSSDFSKNVNQLNKIIPNDCYLLGWSLGAQFAIELSTIKSIKKLITIAYNPKFISTEEWPGTDTEIFQDFYKRTDENFENGLDYFKKLILFGDKDLKQSLKQLSQESHINNKKENLIETLEMLKNNDQRDMIKNSKTSELHIYGAKDCLVPINVSNLLHFGKINIINETGHAPFWSKPEECAQAIKEFINE